MIRRCSDYSDGGCNIRAVSLTSPAESDTMNTSRQEASQVYRAEGMARNLRAPPGRLRTAVLQLGWKGGRSRRIARSGCSSHWESVWRVTCLTSRFLCK
jgi:hypothetical protein